MLAALATPGAFFLIDVSRPSGKSDLEVTGPTLDRFHRRVGDNLNIDVSPTFHQLGGHDAHGAVVGGKRLIQLGHISADGGRAIYEIDEETCLRQIEGCLHSPDSSTDH